VPEHLRDAHYRGARRLGHGEGYEYAHDFPGHFVVQDYLGSDRQFYQPSDQGAEKGIKERLEHWKLEIKKQKGAPHQPQNQKGIDAKE
jgi:putative ATPase